MKPGNLFLIICASVISAGAIVGAILFTFATTNDEKPAAGITAGQIFSEQEEEAFEVDQELEVVVFFQSPGRIDRLVPVKRKVFNTISISEQANQVIQHLIAGPVSGEGAMRTLPRNTRLLKLYISQRGVAHVFFNENAQKFTHGTAAELTSVYSIVNTLCVNYPSIQAVQISVGGRKDTTFAGHIDISYPLPLESSYFATTPVLEIPDPEEEIPASEEIQPTEEEQ